MSTLFDPVMAEGWSYYAPSFGARLTSMLRRRAAGMDEYWEAIRVWRY